MNFFLKSRITKIFSLVVLMSLGACSKPLQHFGKLPDFSLVNQDNQSVSLSTLRGSVWVANFIYTGCGAACPLQTSRMSQLQQVVPSNDVKWVSITVDPETDTPARLKEYAARYKADSQKWFFLTGNTQAIQDVATKGFKLSVAKEDATTIFHSDRFVLVDRNGDIRGYFESSKSTETGSSSLRKAIEELIKEKM